jgi:hypothetical protein
MQKLAEIKSKRMLVYRERRKPIIVRGEEGKIGFRTDI